MNIEKNNHSWRQKPRIAVIGGSSVPRSVLNQAFQVGRLIAERGGILVCGGLGGVMESAARGAWEAGGLTIGILPGINRHQANRGIEIPIVTGVGHARNLMVVRNADAVIALEGKYGTLSEMAMSLIIELPLVSLGSWQFDGEYSRAENPRQAVELAFKLIAEGG